MILASKAQNLPGLINGEGGWELTLERLDRAVANTEWCTLFDVVDVYVLARHCSDHNPLYVVFKNSNDFQWSRRRQFRFEVSWSTHKDHRSLIKQEWRAKAPVENKWSNVIQKLQSCRKALQKWVRKVANPVDGQIKEKMQALQVLQQRADSNCVEDEAVLSSDINAPLEQEEMKWKQRAKENWLQLGTETLSSSMPVQLKGAIGIPLLKLRTKMGVCAELKLRLRGLLLHILKICSKQGRP